LIGLKNIKEDSKNLIQEKVKYTHSTVKESVYTFNTGEVGFVEVDTDRFNGTLKSIIVDMGDMQSLKVLITLKNYPFAKVLDVHMKSSDIFYPSTPQVGVHGTGLIIPSMRDWVLNDILNIFVEGEKNKIVKVVIRFV